MKDCILFLNGTYKQRELAHYQNLAEGKFTVAVDGGYAFFRKAKMFPDLLIGDLDSIKVIPKNLPKQTTVKRYPTHKDQTDAELALAYCLEGGARRIDIVQPSYGEPDQLLGNFLLLSLVTSTVPARRLPQVRIINLSYEVLLLHDSGYRIEGGAGDSVSIIPLSNAITLTTRGTAYNVRGVEVSRGRSLGMRNAVILPRAEFKVRGTALLIRQFRKAAGIQV